MSSTPRPNPHRPISASPFNDTPSAAAGRRTGAGTRAVRASTLDTDLPVAPAASAKRVPAHYTLAPTVPSPFPGTLEGSLDAILSWGQTEGNENARARVADTLLRPVVATTNWPVVLAPFVAPSNAENDGVGGDRAALQSLLFLLTRTLLPNQITQNRAQLALLYDRRKQLAIRLKLRYDMLREWSLDAMGHVVAIPSLPPAAIPSLADGNEGNDIEGSATPLLPNLWATLIAAPAGGFTTHGVRERMKHHVTGLDAWLMLEDRQVCAWNDRMLLGKSGYVLWGFARHSNSSD
jgi:hypothetical protein